ncbi:MAG TPA: phosphodiesterase [Candidatus Binataceae bacterium]|nr:phosphodiesterase [Candidatus Binataceae bacterium]
MIIAQITDLHVVARDRLCYRRVPTNEQLAQAIAHINDFDPAPDVVIASGDLTDHGRPEEYEVLREILSKLKAPIFVIPGNHDRRDALSQAFADQRYMPRPGAAFINYAVEDFPLRLVGLDTTVPDHHHGMMCEDRLLWLDDTLRARPDFPTFIFMHHPPFRTGVQWMDAAGLHGGRKMEEIVAKHRQVVRVACGHIHRPIHLAWGGTIASTSPSTCHQVSLNLTGRGGFDFIMEPRAIQLHVWDPSYGLVSHTSYVPNAYEHVDMLASLEADARRKMLSDARRVYEEMCAEEYERD